MRTTVSGATNRKASLVVGASLLALSTAQPALAQSACVGSVCTVENDGERGPVSGQTGTVTIVTNSGTIAGTPAISQAESVGLLVSNQQGGVIDGEGGVAIQGMPRLIFGIANAGTINGDVVLNDAPAPSIFTAPLVFYIQEEGGELHGNLRLGTTGFGSAYFLQRGEDDGIFGSLSAGAGIDVFAKSYRETGSVALGQYAKPADFEVEGYEVLGTGTTLTLTGSGTTINLAGDGNVVNTATITTLNPVGAYPPGVIVVPTAIGYFQAKVSVQPRGATPANPTPFRSFSYGSALNSFVNKGSIDGDIRLSTASFVNEGDVSIRTNGPGTLIRAAADRAFAFDNSGSIAMAENGARGPQAALEMEYDDGVEAAVRIRSAVDSTAPNPVTIGNSGTIAGGLDARVIASTFAFDNSGTIEGLDSPTYFARGLTLEVGELDLTIGPDGDDEFNGTSATIRNTADGVIRDGFLAEVATDTLRFENAGLIAASTREWGVALQIEHELLSSDADEESGLPEIAASNLTVVNSGTIEGSMVIDAETVDATIDNSGSIVRAARAVDQTNFMTFAYGGEAALEIYNGTDPDQRFVFTNSGTIRNDERGGSAVDMEIEAGEEDDGHIGSADVRVVNTGSIVAAGGATVVPGQLIGMPQEMVLVNPVAALNVDASDVTGTSTIRIENGTDGVISALANFSVLLPNGYQEQAGTAGASSVAIAASGQFITIVNSGRIEGGAGSDYANAPNVVFNGPDLPDRYLAGAIQTLGDEYDPADPAGYVGSIDHVINREGGVIIGSIDLGANDDIIENYGSISGNVFLRDGDDTFIHGLLASFDGIADGGTGTDTLVFDITGALYTGSIDPVLRAKFVNFEIEKLIGTGRVVAEEGITVAEGGELILTEDSTIDVGAGNDAVSGSEGSGETVVLQGTIVGNVNMKGGDNVVTNQASITGDILAGDGNNRIANPEGLTLTGSIALGDGENNVVNQGVVTGDVRFGDGGNHFANSGQIGGDVRFGGGDDVLDLTGDWAIGGAVVGGGGTDIVNASFSSAPVAEADLPVLDLSGFEQIEQFNVNGGTGKIGGTATFDDIQINQGRLIGAQGSDINADVTVQQGGTFGSAGTVNGDITVLAGGTLSPGASPEVMIHNGDLTMASGSNLLFEFVPVGQSDQLLVSGALTIANGATLTITGSRPLTPGIAYDMIVADGGISGEYTIASWDRTAVQGFLRYTPTKLQLLGTFVAASDVATQTGAAIDYVNGLLVSGDAGATLLGAIPTLLDSSGFASTAAFGQLHAEAYASAAQLGVEQGLSLAKSLRSGAAASAAAEPGLYGFAQLFGDWRTLKGDAVIGTARAKSRSHGLLGGIGFGSEAASIGAFVGYMDGRQTIAGLDARTDSDGVIAGIAGHVETGGLTLHALIAHDWSDATTDRAVPGAARVTGDHRLRSFVVDAAIGYELAAGANWAIRPEAGLTHVSTRRGAVAETGSAAFGLAVDSERVKATFVDASLALVGGQADDAAVEPWIKAGFRYQLDGEATTARAGFIGAGSRFVVAGAERKSFLPTLGAGIGVRLAPGMRLTASYEGEYGGGNGHHAALGLRLAF